MHSGLGLLLQVPAQERINSTVSSLLAGVVQEFHSMVLKASMLQSTSNECRYAQLLVGREQQPTSYPDQRMALSVLTNCDCPHDALVLMFCDYQQSTSPLRPCRAHSASRCLSLPGTLTAAQFDQFNAVPGMRVYCG